MYPQMSQEEFKINYEYLTEQLDKIIKKGWIKCTKKGKGASGLILEQLLGKPEENFEYPDYYGFELKVKSYFKYDTLGLFCAVPDSDFFEIKRILETYGYPDQNNRDKKVFHMGIYGDHEVRTGGRYYYRLVVDRQSQNVILKIEDKWKHTVDDKCQWSFAILKEKLERKLNYLVFIQADSKFSYGYKYYKYKDYTIYKLKDFDTFIDLIESGDISINFCIDYFQNGKRAGDVHDHGTSFHIKCRSINKLFDKIS